MMFFARAVVTGFGLSLGSFLFKKVKAKMGWADETDKKSDADVLKQDGAVDPGLQRT